MEFFLNLLRPPGLASRSHMVSSQQEDRETCGRLPAVQSKGPRFHPPAAAEFDLNHEEILGLFDQIYHGSPPTSLKTPIIPNSTVSSSPCLPFPFLAPPQTKCASPFVSTCAHNVHPALPAARFQGVGCRRRIPSCRNQATCSKDDKHKRQEKASAEGAKATDGAKSSTDSASEATSKELEDLPHKKEGIGTSKQFFWSAVKAVFSMSRHDWASKLRIRSSGKPAALPFHVEAPTEASQTTGLSSQADFNAEAAPTLIQALPFHVEAATKASKNAKSLYFEADYDDVAFLMHANSGVGHTQADEDLATAESMATQASQGTSARMKESAPRLVLMDLNTSKDMEKPTHTLILSKQKSRYVLLTVPTTLSSLNFQYHLYCMLILHTQHSQDFVSYLNCISPFQFCTSIRTSMQNSISQDKLSCMHLKHAYHFLHDNQRLNHHNSICNFIQKPCSMLHSCMPVTPRSISSMHETYFNLTTHNFLSCKCFSLLKSKPLSMVTNHTFSFHSLVHPNQFMSHSHDLPFTLMHTLASSSSHLIMHEHPSLDPQALKQTTLTLAHINAYLNNLTILIMRINISINSQPMETSSYQALDDAAMKSPDPSMPTLKATHVITRGGVLAQSIKEPPDVVRHGDDRLKDEVDAALSKVKMKTFILIIYGVTLTLDPG